MLDSIRQKDGGEHERAHSQESWHSQLRGARRKHKDCFLKVERTFDTLKRGYGFFRTRYLGVPKGELEFLLNAMAFNLKKAVLRAGC